jgi:hypothetical protein
MGDLNTSAPSSTASTERRVAIIQSNYVPWKGYFDIIHDADVFVFYDDVQFTKNDWRNRNQIKTSRGLEWLTIPVGKDENRLINQVRLPTDNSWSKQHWRIIEEHYSSAPYFRHYGPWLSDVLLHQHWKTLSALNQRLIHTIAVDFLGVKTTFVRSDDYALSGHKQDRLLDLLGTLGGTTYLSGPSAKSYLDPIRFAKANINLVWKDYGGYPEYVQSHPPFEHAVSILDLLFCAGPSAAHYIWGWRSQGPVSALSLGP